MIVQVDSRSGRYPVIVERGIIDSLGQRMAEILPRPPSGLVLVTDRNVGALYEKRALDALAAAGLAATTLTVEPGEATKTFSCVEDLCRQMARAGLARDALVVALGGGVVGDLAGFAAAVYKRGIGWLTVPTSLLAQVDAAIGGKTGVDLPEGKNLAGAILAPRAVLVDPAVLTTLPEREWQNGLGEVLKYAVLRLPRLFERLRRGDAAGLRRDTSLVDRTIELCATVKAELCAADEFDAGARQALNLGHTFGHAVEAVAGFGGLEHGAAVTIGLVAEADLAERLGLAEQGLAAAIESACRSLGLPTRAPHLDPAAVRSFLATDKKRSSAAPRFALPVRIGEALILEVSDADAIGAAIDRMTATPREHQAP